MIHFLAKFTAAAALGCYGYIEYSWHAEKRRALNSRLNGMQGHFPHFPFPTYPSTPCFGSGEASVDGAPLRHEDGILRDDGLGGYIATLYNYWVPLQELMDFYRCGTKAKVAGKDGAELHHYVNSDNPTFLSDKGHLRRGVEAVLGSMPGDTKVPVLGETPVFYPPLMTSAGSPDACVDVVIIGGGLAGLHTALSLGERAATGAKQTDPPPPRSIVLLEKSRIGTSASGRNHGSAVGGFELPYNELEELVGVALTKRLADQAHAAYSRLKDLIQKYDIRCAAEEHGSVTLCFSSRFVGSDAADSINEEVAKNRAVLARNKDMYKDRTIVWDRDELRRQGIVSERFAYGIFNPDTLQLNPLALSLGLARACTATGHVTIHELSPVIKLEREMPTRGEPSGGTWAPLRGLAKLFSFGGPSDAHVVSDAVKIMKRFEGSSKNSASSDRSPSEAPDAAFSETLRQAATLERYGGGDWLVHTPHGTIRAREVVLATSGAPWSLCPSLALATTRLSTGIILTPPLPAPVLDKVLNTRCSIFDERWALSYFRRAPGDRIIYGGLASGLPLSPRAAEAWLMKDLAATFPELSQYLEGRPAECFWQGELHSRYPLFPLVGRHPSGLWYSLAYCGHGLVPTCAAGEAIANGIASIPDPLAAWRRTAGRPEAQNHRTLLPALLEPRNSDYTCWGHASAPPAGLVAACGMPTILPCGIPVVGPLAATFYMNVLTRFSDWRLGAI